MSKIPKQKVPEKIHRIDSKKEKIKLLNNNIIFSFESLKYNEFFNLDGTCVNWSSDLFDMLKTISSININEIHAGSYSRKGSTLRIHNHNNADPPCDIPDNIELQDLWQMRISKSKGGIHGVFYENIFYVIWLDPQHNMYPDDRYGGIKRIKPPSTCCKDRDENIFHLQEALIESQESARVWEELASSLENETNNKS